MSKIKGHTDGFENQVLDAVSNIPVEYNPKGWGKLSKQLDTELPLNNTKTSNSLKLWLISIGVSTLFVILLLTFYSGPVLNSTTESKDAKSGTDTGYYIERTPDNQEGSAFPKAWNLDEESTKSEKSTPNSDINNFTLDGSSDPMNKTVSEIKKDGVSALKTDSTGIQIQPKNVKNDSLFIFW